MNELREDFLTGRQVIMAPDRSGRPSDLAKHATATSSATSLDDCPFCAGNEAQTPNEVWRWPAAPAGWTARVVPNKYPAPGPLAGGRQPLVELAASPLARGVALCGRHEVIIESPRHVQWMSDLTPIEWQGVIHAWQARLSEFAQQSAELPYRLLFKNVGLSGGASLAHVHSQCLALPWVPPQVAAERERAERLFGELGQCPTCRMLADELSLDVSLDGGLSAGTRIVQATSDWVLLCPYASRTAGELWLIPRRHESDFAASTDRDAIAEGLRQALTRVERALPSAGYNVMVVSSDDSPVQHWRIEILPRTAALAGLELMTGLTICTMLPELAAARLRNTGATEA